MVQLKQVNNIYCIAENRSLNTHSQTIYGSPVETSGPYYQNYTGELYKVF